MGLLTDMFVPIIAGGDVERDHDRLPPPHRALSSPPLVGCSVRAPARPARDGGFCRWPTWGSAPRTPPAAPSCTAPPAPPRTPAAPPRRRPPRAPRTPWAPRRPPGR